MEYNIFFVESRQHVCVVHGLAGSDGGGSGGLRLVCCGSVV